MHRRESFHGIRTEYLKTPMGQGLRWLAKRRGMIQSPGTTPRGVQDAGDPAQSRRHFDIG